MYCTYLIPFKLFTLWQIFFICQLWIYTDGRSRNMRDFFVTSQPVVGVMHNQLHYPHNTWTKTPEFKIWCSPAAPISHPVRLPPFHDSLPQRFTSRSDPLTHFPNCEPSHSFKLPLRNNSQSISYNSSSNTVCLPRHRQQTQFLFTVYESAAFDHSAIS